ncbi:hypothetical protein [Psychromonas ossibalaenae]|uniref:hypothetical protein n=1 Tax=Psychromonas ossibalaenae TaxID=444922 RepID=UPI000371774B|nr:hypothetical protein [Psychromonas ossibalaenae]
MKIEFNGCKTFNCINLANPDLSIYKRSSQLGFDSYQCPECGAFTPVLDNKSIIELTDQILESRRALKVLHCPKCVEETPAQLYGKTKSGTQRRRCSQCATVFSLLNPENISLKLQPFLEALIEGNSPARLHHHLSINSKVFYSRLKQLADILNQVSTLLVTEFLNSNMQTTLHTESHVTELRSGGNQKFGLKCWGLTTAECQYGFQILYCDNLLLDKQNVTGRYDLDSVEQVSNNHDGSFSHVAATYSKIFSRHKFDELAYACQGESQSREGTSLRPVYAAHAHFKVLQKLLPANKHYRLLLEHESFLRGASITHLADRVKLLQCHLYYLYVRPSELLDPIPIEKQNIGWWNESWLKMTFQCQANYWDITICPLTEGEIPEFNVIRGDWNLDFLHHFHQWLPKSYQKTISHKIYIQWFKIFTYLYNFCYSKKRQRIFTSQDVDFKSVESLVKFINETTIRKS